MREKTHCLSEFGQLVGLQVSKKKMEVMALNVTAPAPVSLDDQALLQHRDLYLSGQRCQTGWGYQRGHSQQTEQSQESL